MAFDVRRLDIYRKIPKDLTQPTVTGAIVSIVCCFFIVTLFLSEFLHFISTNITSELFVDNVNKNDRILVRLNVTLVRLKCDYVGLDIQDEMGRHEVGFVENTIKTPIGAEQQGCLFESTFYINKVPGNFHVSTHSTASQPMSIDMAHIIHQVTFGNPMPDKVKGSFNSLVNTDHSTSKDIESHDYVMKIVPTLYEYLDGSQVESFQYTYAYKSSVTFSHTGRIMPAIWFRYDLNPITVMYKESRPPFYTFLTTVCAIVGGTFTVAGIIDSVIYTASELFRKFEIGKLS